MTDLELHGFFEDMVASLRAKGVISAITSGLACVHFGIAESTKDCDLLCHPSSFETILDFLSETQVEGQSCRYRGRISPPLDARWHKGGWTSHMEWPVEGEKVKLDLFGSALRNVSPWEDDLHGLYAGMQVIAWMKRTDRDKDWPFISSLGEQMLIRRDMNGWLHIYDPDILKKSLEHVSIPDELISKRPLLKLVAGGQSELRAALKAERELWQELDRLRVQILRRALKPYAAAITGRIRQGAGSLKEDHSLRVQVAREVLEPNPIGAYGVSRYLQEAMENTMQFIHPNMAKWLPDVSEHFRQYEQ